jgi:hypothetical protein
VSAAIVTRLCSLLLNVSASFIFFATEFAEVQLTATIKTTSDFKIIDFIILSL